MPDPLSATEVAELTGAHIDTVRTALRTGDLPAKRLGQTYAIQRHDALAWASTLRKPGAGPRKERTP